MALVEPLHCENDSVPGGVRLTVYTYIKVKPHNQGIYDFNLNITDNVT